MCFIFLPVMIESNHFRFVEHILYSFFSGMSPKFTLHPRSNNFWSKKIVVFWRRQNFLSNRNTTRLSVMPETSCCQWFFNLKTSKRGRKIPRREILNI
jgi:hypothetical protein